MKILAFAATSSTKSINRQLLQHATALLKEDELEFIDINDYEIPLFSEDREAEFGQPQKARDFRKKIGDADAIVIAFAEHNGSYTAAWKNLFDWTSRINQKVFQGKPAIYLATSPGPGGAANVLQQAVASAPHFDSDVKASMSVPSFYDNFDLEKGRLRDDTLASELENVMQRLKSSAVHSHY